jgi:hypothetical protein
MRRRSPTGAAVRTMSELPAAGGSSFADADQVFSRGVDACTGKLSAGMHIHTHT